MPVVPPTTSRPAPRRRSLVAALAFGGVVTAVMQTIVVPLLPHLPELTGSTPENVSWTLTATLLAGAVCTPILGRVGDMYGKRTVLAGTMALLVAGSLMCALTSHVGVLIAGRALQGAALAAVPLGISIMRDQLPPARLAPSVALMSSTVGIGAAIGVPLAALVVQYADWHTMFWASAGLGLLDLLLVLTFVPASKTRSGGRFDLGGALGLAATLICLLMAVSKGGAWGWTSAATLGTFTAALAIGLGWGAYELRVSSPMVDLRLSARPAVLLTNIAAMLIGFAFYANSLATAQLVQEPAATGYGIGASIFVSGLCLLPGGVAMLLFSPVSGRISVARGPRFTLLLASVIIAAGYVVRLFTSHQMAMIIVGATVVAIGTAIAYSALPTLIMQYVPVSETGAANGLNTLMRTVGQATCSAVVAAVLAGVTMQVEGGGTAPALNAYLLVFVIACGSAIAAFAVTLCISSRTTASAAAAHENTPQPALQESR